MKKVPKFKSLEKLDAWAKKNPHDRKEKKAERKRIKKVLRGR